MVISEKYKYVFIELPFTASTSVSAELCENYSGIKILHKHSRYHEFHRIAKKEAKKYFVFSSIRNPMDAMVSVFFKLKYNHKGKFTEPKEWEVNGGNVLNKDLKKFSYIQKHNLNFQEYFKKYFYYPYDNWSRLDHKNFDFIIRFEHLQDDFSLVLQKLNIPQIRPLPQINKTKNKEREYKDYYTSDIRQRALNIFGPFMKEWGFEFPKEWGATKISPLAQFEYESIGFMKSIYWRLIPKSNAAQRKKLLGELKQLINHC